MIMIDIEMPEKCCECPCFHADYPMHCQLIKPPDNNKRLAAPYGLPRPDWCPLLNVEGRGNGMNERENFINNLERAINLAYGGGREFIKLTIGDVKRILQLLKEQDNCENCAIAIEDRQPVVRCKDCKNWLGNGTDPSELPYFIPCKNITRTPDYFCADAERR